MASFYGALSRQQCRSNDEFEASVCGAVKSLRHKPKDAHAYLEMDIPPTQEQWESLRPSIQQALDDPDPNYVVDVTLVVMLLILRFGKDYLGVGVRHHAEWFFWGQNTHTQPARPCYMTVDMAKLYPGAVKAEESIKREKKIYRRMTQLAMIFVLGILTLLVVRF